MKKFYIIALAVVLCFAFTAPAMAKVSVGGLLTTDFYYLDQSDERTTPCVKTAVPCNRDNGVTETNIYLPQTRNRLSVKYNNDDKTLTGYLQIRGGGVNGGNTLDWK
jgi:hypothetical protein